MQKSSCPLFAQIIGALASDPGLKIVHHLQRTNISPSFVGQIGFEEVCWIAPKKEMPEVTHLNALMQSLSGVCGAGETVTVEQTPFQSLGTEMKCGRILVKKKVGTRAASATYSFEENVSTEGCPEGFPGYGTTEDIFAWLTLRFFPSVELAHVGQQRNTDTVEVKLPKLVPMSK